MKKTIFITIISGIILFSDVLPLFAQEATDAELLQVTEKALNTMPCLYYKKNIVTEGTFLGVSYSLLDDIHHDKETRFSSKDYLNFRTNNIFHYFIKQDQAAIIPALNPGDRIIISGYVRSCADKSPWIEVDSVIKAPSE